MSKKKPRLKARKFLFGDSRPNQGTQNGPVKARPPTPQAAAAAAEAQREPRLFPDAVAASAEFLDTYEWRRVRMQALKKYGAKCMCCGATPATGAVMNVDHIRPRRLFPELALDINNLQVLCHECNHGKGNWDMTDWREIAMSGVG